MQVKTVRVTNPNNVLVQIPGFVVAQWDVQLGDMLEVSFDDGQLRINKAVHERSDTIGQDEGVA